MNRDTRAFAVRMSRLRGVSVVVFAFGCGRHDPGTSALVAATPPPELQPDIAAGAAPCSTEPRLLGPGLTAELAPLDATPAAPSAAPCIDIVRADLARYRLRVLTGTRDGTSHPAPAWRDAFHLVAVTNAGMFHAEGLPVGLIVEDGVAISVENKQFGGYLAFDPIARTDPPAIIAGRDCPGFSLDDLRARYRSIVQSSRLLDCDGAAIPWQDKKQYSAAAIGIDHQGHIAFLHVRAAVTMTELSRALAAKDLGLTGALFLEGGPEASLVVRGSEGELARVGSYETDFLENDTNQSFWWLPNVLGLEAR